MDLGKLKRTLLREAKRSPAKTGTLVAMLPVAAYFILPLFMKSSPTSASTAVAAPVPIAVATPEAAVETTHAAAGWSWRQLATHLAEDPRMKPTAETGDRDPFQPVVKEQVAGDGDGQQTSAPVVERSPEEFGLVLAATMIGKTRSLASINGRLLSIDSEIRVDPAMQDGGAGSLEPVIFKLRSVETTHVMLERDGNLYRLGVRGDR